MNRISYNFLIIVLSLTLAACASQPGNKSTHKEKSVSPKGNVQSMLVAAERASSPEAEILKLAATGMLLSQRDLSQAELVLSTLHEQELSDTQKIRFVFTPRATCTFARSSQRYIGMALGRAHPREWHFCSKPDITRPTESRCILCGKKFSRQRL